MSNEAGARAQVVVPAEVRRLLARADAELVAAALAQDAGERFVHAHLPVRCGPRPRSSRSVRAPAPWARPHGLGAARGRRARARRVVRVLRERRARACRRGRGAVRRGRPRRADELVACAEDFRDEVAMLVDPDAGFVRLPGLRTVAS